MKLEMCFYDFTKQEFNKNNSLDTSEDSEKNCLLVFGNRKMNEQFPQVINNLNKKFPKSHFIGCSSAGEIFNKSIIDDSLSIALIQLEDKNSFIRSYSFACSDFKNSKELGNEISEHFKKEENLRGIFLLCDGLNVNGSELILGINERISPQVVVSGGLAADSNEFERTWTVFKGELLQKHVVAIGLYGPNIYLETSSKGGWDKFGPQRKVSKSIGNVLYEIDGKIALKLYKEYLGDLAKELPSTALLFPLYIDKGNNQGQIRTILGIDEKNQSMIFAGDIPQGSLVQLMKTNVDRLIDGAIDASSQILKNIPKNHLTRESQKLLIAISCVGRRLVLKQRTEEEIEGTLDTFESIKTPCQQIGFYSYGEISSQEKGQLCELHNQTMTLTLLYENI